jgi:hypothetical protein
MPYDLEQYEQAERKFKEERDTFMIVEYMKAVAPKTKLKIEGYESSFNLGVIQGVLKSYFAGQPVNFDTIEQAVQKATEMNLLHYEPAPPTVITKVVEGPAKPKPLAQMEHRNDTNTSHADRQRAEEKIQKAREANPLNDPAFIAKQRNAEAEVKATIARYQVYRGGKVDFSRTNEHKEILNSVKIESYLRDEQGNKVVLWDQTLLKIRELVAGFEKKREYSR